MQLPQAIDQLMRDSRSLGWEPAIAQGAPDSGYVAVNASGGTESAACPVGLSPKVGDVVAIIRGTTPLVVGILWVNPQNEDEDPAPDPGGPGDADSSGTSRFPAVYTKTWTYWSGGIGAGVDIDDSLGFNNSAPQRQGWWFYQSAITSALTGATVDSARLRFPASDRPGGWSGHLVFADNYSSWPTPYIQPGNEYRREPEPTGAAPEASAVSTTGGGAQWVAIPVVAAQAMTTTRIAVGVGLGDDDPLFTQGLSTDPESGLLEITWHR